MIKKTYLLKYAWYGTDLFLGEKNGNRFGKKFCFVVKNVEVIQKGKQLKSKEDSIKIKAIIEMAWCDKTSFNSIKEQTGLLEKEVINNYEI